MVITQTAYADRWGVAVLMMVGRTGDLLNLFPSGRLSEAGYVKGQFTRSASSTDDIYAAASSADNSWTTTRTPAEIRGAGEGTCLTAYDGFAF
jgi:hypothetical protein